MVILAVLQAVPAATHASFLKLSPGELLARSQLVATGQLLGITPLRVSGDGETLRVGILRLERVFRGPEQRTTLIVLPPEEPKVVSSDRVDYSVGASGLWYLRRYRDDSRGLYLADHPQRLLTDDQTNRLRQRIERLAPDTGTGGDESGQRP